MSEFDHSDLDGRALQLLLAVVEEGSITRAAVRLGVTQSAVSHSLDKLRQIVNDPLFVKSGRGIVATARAEALAVQARLLLDDLRRFVTQDRFDPKSFHGSFTIAANDFQRDLLLPGLMARLREKAPALSLRIMPSGVPSAELLREERCQLVISPRPPQASDIIQKRLFEDEYRVFYDPAMRGPPRDAAEYLEAEHVTVVYEPRRSLDIDQVLQERGLQRSMAVQVPGFAGIGPFLRGSTWLATLPGLLNHGMLSEFASSPVPVKCPPMPMYMIWHLRNQHDPVHQWLRQELEATTAQALQGAQASQAAQAPNSSVSTSA